MSTSTLSRRRFLVGSAGLGLAAAAGIAPSAVAADFVIKGKILEGYYKAGGEAVLGEPLANEVKVVIRSSNTYGQKFENGQVWYGSGVLKHDVVPGCRVRLSSKAPNFRPVGGGLRDLWRSDDLDGLSPLDERIVRDLGIKTQIRFNSGSDPAISGVKNVAHYFPNSPGGEHLSFYRNYVTQSDRRAAIGAAAKTVALSTAPLLYHCAAGKDRTGWFSSLMQEVAGVSRTAQDVDYLATEEYSGQSVDLAWLNAAREAMEDRYADVDDYLTRGCGLSVDNLAALRVRLS